MTGTILSLLSYSHSRSSWLFLHGRIHGLNCVEGIREKPAGPIAGGRVLEEVGSKAPSPVWGRCKLGHRGPATSRFSAFWCAQNGSAVAL